MKSFLFLHGGPGYNSELEREVLGPLLKEQGWEARFWNEPSANRPDGDLFQPERAYSGWIESAEKALNDLPGQVLVTGNSFGAIAAVELAQRNPQKVGAVIGVAPCLDLVGCIKGMMELAAKDLTESDPDATQDLNRLILETKSILDEPMQAGLGLAAKDAGLVAHYWTDKGLMGRWAGFLGQPEFAHDPNSFGAALMEYKDKTLQSRELPKLEIPVALVFGQNDPVIDPEIETAEMQRYFSSVKTEVFEEAGHFGHIEAADRFMKVTATFWG